MQTPFYFFCFSQRFPSLLLTLPPKIVIILDHSSAHAEFLGFCRPKSELWCAVAAKHGAWFHPHHNWYLTASHTADDIEQTVAIAGKAFDAVADAYR